MVNRFMRKYIHLTLALGIVMAAPAYSQIHATTDEGRAVLLRADGTWQYADSAGVDTTFDLRLARWEMNREAVRASESSAPLEETPEALTWADTLSGMACKVSYIFIDDKLAAARYTFTETRENKNTYLGDYSDLKQALTDKYGKPQSSKTRWLNENYKSSPQYWGLAVSMGQMTQTARWQTPRSDVELTLAGAEFHVLLTIDYSGRALEGRTREVR